MKDERKTKDLSLISNIITPFAKKILGKRGFVEIDIITNWDKIIGQELAEFTIPQKIDFKKGQRSEGTLHVQVITGAFALELQHRERSIIEKINTYFGYNAVSKLKIFQDSNNFKELSLKCNNNKDAENLNKSLVNQSEETYIRDVTKNLENPELKEILTKLGYNIASSNHEKDEKK